MGIGKKEKGRGKKKKMERRGVGGEEGKIEKSEGEEKEKGISDEK
jgi:hypothetical protein